MADSADFWDSRKVGRVTARASRAGNPKPHAALRELLDNTSTTTMAPKRATASKAAPAAPRRSSRLASRESSKEPESQSQHPVTNVTEDSAPLPAITEVKPAPKAKQPKETGTGN